MYTVSEGGGRVEGGGAGRSLGRTAIRGERAQLEVQRRLEDFAIGYNLNNHQRHKGY